MKTKTKFFTILLVLTSFALSACGNPFLPSKTQKSSSKPEETSFNSSRQENTSSPSSKTPWTASSSSSSSYNPSHQHSYGEWQRVVEPTCTEEGLEERTCYICGIKTSRALPALGHEWSEWYVGEESSCTSGGYEEHKCVRCGEVEKRDIEPAHLWNNEQYISPIGEGYVGYDLTQCARGDAIKVDIKTIDGTFAEGSSNKVGSLEGFIKLSGNNQSISWVFNLATSYSYYGILYQRGMMDSWPNTNSGSYARTSSGYDYENGNFQVTVNGNDVDKTPYINIPYAEMFAEGEDSSYLGSNYSPIALVPIGYVSLQSGVNEIVYKRLNSYNPVISDLVFIGEEYDHVHNVSPDWLADTDYHWHGCSEPNCPGLKYDIASHDFGEWTVEIEPTCTEMGRRSHICVICGQTVYEDIAANGHNYGDWTITSEATCTNSGRQEHTCLVCGSTSSEEIPVTAHNYGEWFVDPENENNRYHICASCGHVDTREFPSGNYYLWLEEDLMSVFENPGTVKEVDYADGSRCFKSNIFNQGGNITLRFDSAYARTLRLKMYISVKIANVSKTGFWMQSNAEKMKITLNGETIVPPEVDLDFDALGCNIKDDIANDSGNLSIPVWVDICDLNLVAGENQLMFEMNTSAGYSFYIGGCGLFGI